MAAKSRRAAVTSTGKMTLPGKTGPQRFHYCIEHDMKMTPVLLWDSKVIRYECKDGCRLAKNEAALK